MPGYGPLDGIRLLGMQFLDFFDFITNSILMPIAALCTCVIIGHYIGTKFVTDEVEVSGTFRTKRAYVVLVKWVCPVCMALILVTGLLDFFGIYEI